LPHTSFQDPAPTGYIDPDDLDGSALHAGDEMLAPAEATSVFPFDNSYARLPERFFARLPPTPVAAPGLVRLNTELAQKLGLDPARLSSPEGVAILAGNAVPKLGEPLAMAYAGHQFGTFVPQLGDGRALLLGEVVGLDGVRRDIQLKGSGPTPFSRNGDGRAALGPVLREYIISEAMDALAIPTTRSLAVVTTGQAVRREMPLPGAVLTRVAASHIRVGTFQFFAARGDVEALLRLADYVIARHYPEAARAEKPYRQLLELVITRQAELVAKWLLVGFIHGVMNTDNMSIAGETIDYGPCAFIDTYDPEAVYSSIDNFGRYAYGNQPRIAQWNLARLAETLLPLLADHQEAAVEMANEALGKFVDCFEAAYASGLRRKLGLLQERPDDIVLARDLLDRMAQNRADFTLTFRRLSDAAISPDADMVVRSLFSDPTAYDDWALRWRRRLADDGEGMGERQAAVMRAVNPAFIPRNHLVEEALSAAVETGDFSRFDNLLTVLSRPFDDQPIHRRYGEPPRPDQVVHQTFCGT
jgi:serine/tyrosine/threonine adenylyltransferase